MNTHDCIGSETIDLLQESPKDLLSRIGRGVNHIEDFATRVRDEELPHTRESQVFRALRLLRARQNAVGVVSYFVSVFLEPRQSPKSIAEV
jgi:hypothetical protein